MSLWEGGIRKGNTISILLLITFSVIVSLTIPVRQAYGHAFVTSSDPSSLQSVPTSPSKVVVFFSEPVDIRFSKLNVLDQNGKQIGNKDIHYLNGDQSALSVSLPQLKDGVYTVSTTVLSEADGHVTDNAFVFAVGEAAIPSTISTTPQTSVIYIPEAISRFPTLVGQVIIVGGAFSTLWLWRPISRISSLSALFSETRRRIDKRLVSVFLIGSIILVASNFAILIFQAFAISASLIDTVTTRFGTVLLARIILSVTLLGISIFNYRKYRKSSQILSRDESIGILAIGISLLLTTSLIGHGAANNQFSSIAIDFIHNLAASIWIGGVIYLGFIFTSKLHAQKSLERDHQIALLSFIIPRFSTVVVTILGFIVFTGPFLLYILDSNLAEIPSSLYGKTLIVKLTLAVIMLAIGSYNQLSIQKESQARTNMTLSVSSNGKSKDLQEPHTPDFLDDGPGKTTNNFKSRHTDIISRFSRSTKAESIVGILLLASVAFLVNTGLPANERASPPQQQANSNMMTQQFQQGFQSTYFIDNDTRIILSVNPFTVGSNNFTVSFVDAHNNPLDVSSSTLKYTETEKSIGPIDIDLQKVSKGLYSAQGAFGIPGLWDLQIEGIPNKLNSPAMSATFNDLRIKPRLDQLQFSITELNTPSNGSQPLYPIYDKSRNSIWVGDTAVDSGQILEYQLDTNKYIQHKINDTSIITILAQDSKNNIWFVDPIMKLIGDYAPASSQHRLFPLPKTIIPSSIAVDPNDRLWITSPTTSQVLIFNPQTNNITKQISLEKGARPLSIAINSMSGLAWISDERGKLIMIDPLKNYTSTVYTPTAYNSTLKSPTGLLLDNIGDNVFISQHEGHRVSVFNTVTNTFQDYPPLDPNGLPFGMAFDKYGNIWVAQHTIKKIAVIDPQTGKTKQVKIPNETPFVQWITSDSDGNIWIAEQRGHALGLITTKVGAPISSPLSPTKIPTKQAETTNTLYYNLLVAPAIMVGLALTAFMYVKSVIDCKVAERTLRKYFTRG